MVPSPDGDYGVWCAEGSLRKSSLVETSIFTELKVTGGRDTGGHACVYTAVCPARLTIPRTGMRGVAS